ncbi:MAG: HEAT repeat domain-containing protein [bacterium]|nr:HEAT repeat domain-containing protein [bacterium]
MRRAAIVTIGMMFVVGLALGAGALDDVEALREALATELRNEIAEATDPVAAEFVLAALTEESSAERREAIEGSIAHPHPRRVRALELILGSDRDARVRETAIEALSDIGGERATWALARALADREPGLREEAIYALEEIGGDVARLLLLQARADSDPGIRDEAAALLEEMAD